MTKQGKKETIWKRSGTNQASIVKSGIEGANYYEGEEKKEANKRDNETSDGNPRRLAIYLFRRAPRFPFMTTVKFTPRVNNELNPFFSSFQQATNPCMYITCTYIYIRLNEFLVPRYVQLFPVTLDIMAVGRLNGREETAPISRG